MKDYCNANTNMAVHLKVFLVMFHINVRDFLGYHPNIFYYIGSTLVHSYVTYMHYTCILLVIEYQYFIDLRTIIRAIIKRCRQDFLIKVLPTT